MVKKLYNILSDLQNYKHSKDEVMLSCINDRLNASIKSYYADLTNCFETLRYRDEMKVMKNLNKE